VHVHISSCVGCLFRAFGKLERYMCVSIDIVLTTLLLCDASRKSVRGNIFIPPGQLQVFQDTNDMGTVDWVICALKSTGLDAIPDLIYPLLGKHTRVLTIMNGLIEEDLLAMLAKRDGKDPTEQLTCCAAVYGGMALLCSNRVAPGHIDHSYAGLLSAGVAATSLETSTPDQHQAAFEALWQPADVDVVYEPSLLRGRWKKNCWNLPFNGISVAMGGVTIDIVVNDAGLRKLAYTIMDETIRIANEDLKQNGYDESWYLGEAEKKQMMDLSDAMGPYKTSTMLDLVERRPMEVQFLFRKPLERADRLGIKAPHLETLVVLIEAYQRMYGL
jgi:2-dehydropantoate 2-reductase